MKVVKPRQRKLTKEKTGFSVKRVKLQLKKTLKVLCNSKELKNS